MKKVFLIAAAIASSIMAFSQQDYSGAYGYLKKPEGNPPKTEEKRGPSGNLVLLKMEGNKYRFWLDVNQGWPNYGVGETDGTIILVNDTASFDNTFENAMNPCMLKFQYANNSIHISSASASYNCGFSSGVKAEGDYSRLKPQPPLDNEWLHKEYAQSPIAIIGNDNTEIFQDENCKKPFVPARGFPKGTQVLTIAENDHSIYTEHISASGQFLYGWIRKSDIK